VYRIFFFSHKAYHVLNHSAISKQPFWRMLLRHAAHEEDHSILTIRFGSRTRLSYPVKRIAPQ